MPENISRPIQHRVTEYHADGFRFDLASILCRGTDGAPLASPPIIRVIMCWLFGYPFLSLRNILTDNGRWLEV